MSRILILIGIGGLIGSVLRYLVSTFFFKVIPVSFPMGTFAVNIIGALTVGVFYGLSERYQSLSIEWRFFLITGICGGFTTFSAFTLEIFQLIKNEQYFVFTLYAITSVIVSILALLGGIFLTKISF